jgi:hypothetical protein
MFKYTATKGKECILCEFDNLQDMVSTMMRHLSAGYSVTKV